MDSVLSFIDILTLVIYFGLIFGISVIISKQHTKESNPDNTESYFLAERSVGWLPVAASLFASNIGSEHFIGLAGSAARDGIAVGWYEVGAIPVILFTGLFFVPVYFNSKVQTTPDYLEKRYSLYCRTLIVCVSLILYVLSKVSATLFAGQLILVELLHVNPLVAVFLLVAFTAFYTILGGLEAVIYTEALQTIVLLVGGFMVVGFTLSEVNGFDGLREELDPSFFHFFRSAEDEAYPWTGFLFGYYVISPWYWGIDQVIVQRAIAAKNVAHGQFGCVGAAFLKFLPFFIMIVPGLGAHVLISKSLTEEEFQNYNFDLSYVWLVLNIIPKNLRGVIIASMISSLMSALASVFNSSATLFTLNIYKQRNPDSTEAQLVQVGRISIIVIAIVSLLWLPIMPYLGDRLFIIIQKPPAFFAPPVLCVFLWGMLSHYPHKDAGKWTLNYGIVLGGARFILEIIEDVAMEKYFGLFTSMNFLIFACISFWSSTAVLFILSYFCRHGWSYVTLIADDTSARAIEEQSRLFFRLSLFDELMNPKRKKQIQMTKLNNSQEEEQTIALNNNNSNGNGHSIEEDYIDHSLNDIVDISLEDINKDYVRTFEEQKSEEQSGIHSIIDHNENDEDENNDNEYKGYSPSKKLIFFCCAIIISLWMIQVLGFA